MARSGSRFSGVGFHPFASISNLLIWISAVIVMGIVSYWISQNNNQGSHIIYEEVIAVLTVVFFLAAFFLGTYSMVFNVIFSYLWLVSVVFTAQDFSNSNNSLGETVEAFSFIAFFLLFFNVLFHWHSGMGPGVGGTRTTSAV